MFIRPKSLHLQYEQLDRKQQRTQQNICIQLFHGSDELDGESECRNREAKPSSNVDQRIQQGTRMFNDTR